MVGLVETYQHGPRSRTGDRNRGVSGSGAVSRTARERATRKKLEAKRRTARSNFCTGLGSARHERRPKTHAACGVRVAHASRVLVSASRRNELSLRLRLEWEIRRTREVRD